MKLSVIFGSRRVPALVLALSFSPISIAAVGVPLEANTHRAETLPASKPLKVPVLKYESYQLANGLQVLTHEDHRLPLVAVDVWYHVGPVNEKAGRTGFAHLFEHMMFEGSEHVGEKAHIQYLEGAGATDINGTTDFDRTNYFETLPSNQLELGLWLESDRMGFLLETLDRARLTNQRDVVRNERRQHEGSPYSLGDEAIFHLLFPREHPYYASVMGSHADIESARLNDIRDFFQHYYTPNNASIAIAGDFEPAKLKSLLEKYFAPIPRGPEVDKVDVQMPPITREKRATVTDTVQLPRVSVAWLAPPAFAPGDADADLFTQILGGGKSSRLYRTLVYEQQVAQSADCGEYSLKLISVVYCDVVARPGVKPEALEAAINKEIDALRSSGPTPEEAEQARTGTLTSKISGLQRLGGFGGVADMLDRYNQYVGDPGYLPKDIARYQAVTPASIQKLSQQYFAQNQRVVVYTVPGQKVVDDVPRSPADTDANVKVVPPYAADFEAGQQWRKTAPAAGADVALHLPVPKMFSLSNGMQVYLLEEHALPVISASVVSRAGSEANPSDKPGLAAFTADLLTEGTRERSSVQLANDAAKIGASLSSSATMDNSRARIESLSNNSDAAMDLLADVTLHPAFKPEEVERARKQRLTSILQEGDEPFYAALRVGRKALYGDYPYGYLDIGTTSAVNAITRDDLTRFWETHYAPASAALLLAGDMTEAEAKQLASKYFGDWKKKEKVEAVSLPPEPPTPTRKIVIVDKPGSPQTTLIAFGMGTRCATPENPAVTVLNNVLGGLFSSRINMNLREKNGFTYGGFSDFQCFRTGGFFYTGAQVRTDVTAAAAKELFTELNRIRTDPPTPQELKLATDYSLHSMPGDFDTVRAMSGLMSSLFIYKLPPDYYQQMPSKYLALTPEAVEKVALTYVHPESLVVMAVGDRMKIEPGIQKLELGPIEVRDESGDLVKK